MSKTREMSDDERYVREAYNDPEAAYINCGMGSSFWQVSTYCGFEICRVYCGAADGGRAAWSAARAFTEQRRKEIADKQEEIAWLSDGIDVTGDEEPIGQRILAVLESQLAELTRGLRKPEENQ